MAAIELFDPKSLQHLQLDPLQPISLRSNAHPATPDIWPRTNNKSPSLKMENNYEDGSSADRRGIGEEGSASRESFSEQKPERAGPERRTRARRGSMREYSSDSEEEYEGTRRRRGERRGLTDSKYKKNLSDFHFERPDPITAAKNKANRERQRRERLNDSFAELVKTLDPEGSIKGEKTSIIAGTIKSINSLRKDVDKLRHEKSEMQNQLAQMEKEKRDVEFRRAMLEQQLEDLRLSVYSQRVVGPIGARAELASEMDVPHHQQQSPSGLSRLLQEQATLQSNGQQRSFSPMEARLLQQELQSQQNVQQQANSFLPMLGSQPMDHAMQQPGPHNGMNQGFNPNADFLDMDNILTPDGMSMSPILWLNEALGPDADESYMCSNL